MMGAAYPDWPEWCTHRAIEAAMRQRLDVLLVERGLAPNCERARALILAGRVFVDDRAISKAGSPVAKDCTLRLRLPEHPYVSRGGIKLAAALETLGVDPNGATCMDVGASTGGFTDVLLQRGARRVYAVDVGYGLIDARLRADARVVVKERTNARTLSAEHVPESIDLATVDVSFISLRLVLPAIQRLLAPKGRIVALVKPQFEAERGDTTKGVVRNEAVRRHVIEAIAQFARHELGFEVAGACDSAIRGPKGNLEHFLLLAPCRSS